MNNHNQIFFDQHMLIADMVDCRTKTHTARRKVMVNHYKPGNTRNEDNYDKAIGQYSQPVKPLTDLQAERYIIMIPIVQQGIRDEHTKKQINIKLAYAYDIQRKNMEEVCDMGEEAIKKQVQVMLKDKNAKNINQQLFMDLGGQYLLFI